ncbi:MAG: CdaR family protein [Erysipelotrichales bacterium]
MSNKDNLDNHNEEQKKRQRIAEARKIARQSGEIVSDNYVAFSKKFIKLFRGFNRRLDFILTNSLSAKIISIFLAILLYLNVTTAGDINVFGESNAGKTIYNVPVKVIYDKNKTQVENLPNTVDISLVGNMDAIRRTEMLDRQEVIADLTNFKPGLKQKVSLMYSGVAEGVDVKFSQPTYEVDIYETKEKKFNIIPELTKVPVNNEYEYSYIRLEQNTITIKAAQHTLDKIATVKVMIDVANQKESFSQDANIVVLDEDGEKIPISNLSLKSVKVSVNVTKKHAAKKEEEKKKEDKKK